MARLAALEFMRALLAFLSLAVATGCSRVPPPRSLMPSAGAALDRMHATYHGCNGVKATANVEVSRTVALFFHPAIRTDVMMYAALPSLLRMDVVSDFGVTLATLTVDGPRFGLGDMRASRFYYGPASACAVEQLTTVPVHPNALVALLRGQAPVLVHAPRAGELRWSFGGHYVVTIPSTNGADEEILLAPHPADFDKPWTEQRIRVLGVTVRQHDDVLYAVTLAGHAPAPMSSELVDPDGLEAPIPPSGPVCSSELPRTIHIEVPSRSEELDLRMKDVAWNPPYPDGVFQARPPAGMRPLPVPCE